MNEDTPMNRWLLKVQDQVDDEMQIRRKMASDINDLKNTTHHIKITPLVAGSPVEEYKGLSKYDSKRLTEAENGL